jgi:hypothetical protein
MNPVVPVSTPSIGFGWDGTSSTYTPGARYSGIGASVGLGEPELVSPVELRRPLVHHLKEEYGKLPCRPFRTGMEEAP